MYWQMSPKVHHCIHHPTQLTKSYVELTECFELVQSSLSEKDTNLNCTKGPDSERYCWLQLICPAYQSKRYILKATHWIERLGGHDEERWWGDIIHEQNYIGRACGYDLCKHSSNTKEITEIGKAVQREHEPRIKWCAVMPIRRDYGQLLDLGILEPGSINTSERELLETDRFKPTTSTIRFHSIKGYIGH